MAGGNLYDEARVRALPAGAEIVLEKRDIATPAALDVAFARGIRVRYAVEGATPQASGGTPATTARGGAWSQMLAQDGTYVVEVKAGRAVVHRLTPNGPMPLKEG